MKKTKRKFKLIKRLLITLIVTIVLVLIVMISAPLPVPVFLANKFAFSNPTEIVYDSQGTLNVLLADGDIAPVSNNVCVYDIDDYMEENQRTVYIYTPPNFDEDKTYPVMFCLHGFAARPNFWIHSILHTIDTAIIDGQLDPMVVVIPDGTIGGNGLDNEKTKYDDRGGAWYIDSKVCSYETYFMDILPSIVEKFAKVSDNPKKRVLMGSSMGGFGSLYYSAKYPELFKNAIAFYPPTDLNYSINDDRLLDYDEKNYASIDKDKPLRIVNKLSNMLGLTDAWLYYPVFSTFDMPIYKAMEQYNIKTIVQENSKNMQDTNWYILVGDKDDFNFDAQLDMTKPMLEETGINVSPDSNIVGGYHNFQTFFPYSIDIVNWIDSIIS